jgi:LDH2 family malate/lactate/ureidoglycolate dehydrogenase
MTDSVRLRPADLHAAVRHALTDAGVPDAIAAIEAEVMVEADLYGVPSHGVIMLPKLLAGLRDGRAKPDPVVRIVRERGAACLVDGENGPGRYVAVRAMEEAVRRAAAFGVGLCVATRTTHWGRAHAYAVRAARAGMIGCCTTNAIPTMMLPGVPKPLFGNNPLAIGVPRRQGEEPIVLDLAMTRAAFGKVATHRREGRPVPDAWGVDRDGHPSPDPAAILESGALQPMGAHKGVGLALMMELLTAGLTGGLFAHEIVQRDASALDPHASKSFLAIDPGALAPDGTLAGRTHDLVDYLHAADPDGHALAPGERGWRAREEYERDGIPIHEAIIAQLRAAGVALRASC